MPSLNNSSFKGENFCTDDYIPLMGWIRSDWSQEKIYRREDSREYQLFDEIINALAAFAMEGSDQCENSIFTDCRSLLGDLLSENRGEKTERLQTRNPALVPGTS